MQDFSTADARHDFTLDGARYYIPAVTPADITTIATSADLPMAEQGAAMREFLAGAARSHRGPVARFFTGQMSARRAVEALSLIQVTDLFKAWAGMGKDSSPGESSSSAETPDGTPLSSPQTSPSSTTAESQGPTYLD